jgi:hypothetical protein
MVPEMVAGFDRSLIFIRNLIADLTEEEMVLQFLALKIVTCFEPYMGYCYAR